MYMPNLTPRDAHRLWLDAEDTNEKSASLQSLSSYSPAYLGSLNLIDQSKQQAEFFKPINTNDKIDPSLNVANLVNFRYLDSFRVLGYNTLKPIGLNKTMQQLDEEKHELEELQRSNNADFYGNEEERAAIEPTNDTGNEQSFEMLLGENTRTNNTTTSTTATGNTINNSNANDQFQFENDQDFMAEDEEYQDDHSISMDSDTNSRRIVRSNPIFTGTLPTGSTQQTSAYETRSYYRNVSNSSANGMSSLRNEVRVSSTHSDYDM